MGSQAPRRYGVLLPHFGSQATPSRVLDGAQQAEEYGFDSIWVRDHLVYHPHEQDDPDRTHVEPMTTLAAIAARTQRVILGTASLIPHRNPVYMAEQLAALAWYAGDRVIAGWGIGTFDHEFDVAGLAGIPRDPLLREQVEIMRRLWTGERVDYQGAYYQLADVDVHPTPPGGTIPIYYCGSSAAATRRAVEFCDGWLGARIPLTTYEKRMQRLRTLSDEASREMPVAGAIPIVSPAATREKALAKVNVEGLVHNFNTRGKWVVPPSGRFETADDIEGALIAGPPEHIVATTRAFQETGLSHMVFDLRFRFDEWDECLRILGEEVLPELRLGDAAGAEGAAGARGAVGSV